MLLPGHRHLRVRAGQRRGQYHHPPSAVQGTANITTGSATAARSRCGATTC
jgi:hypothetical protein